MANLNRVFLIGNLTRDPQLSYLPSGTPVAEFGLATNRRWRGTDGEMKEETCFIDCKAFGRNTPHERLAIPTEKEYESDQQTESNYADERKILNG